MEVSNCIDKRKNENGEAQADPRSQYMKQAAATEKTLRPVGHGS
jgi:hypothetical protein